MEPPNNRSSPNRQPSEQGLEVFNSLRLETRKRAFMCHIGEKLRTAIAHSSFTPKEVGRIVGLGENTIYRWMSSPNLDLKAILKIHKAIPELYLKGVFDGFEEKYGHEVPENPYSSAPDQPQEPDDDQPNDGAPDPGITIMLDAAKFQGYQIPKDFIDNVQEMLERAQKSKKGKGKSGGEKK